jgi:DNA-directed RNA polymerase subunit omega
MVLLPSDPLSEVCAKGHENMPSRASFMPTFGFAMNLGTSIFPDPDKLNHMEYGKFVLTNLAARRARQIRDGAPPLVRIESNHPLSIALAEIAAGKIKPIMGTGDATPIDIDEHASIENSLDPGLLLPGIDEIGAPTFDDEEFELEADDEAPATLDEDLAITDLLEDDLAAATPSDDEISLDDLASEEEGDVEEPGIPE